MYNHFFKRVFDFLASTMGIIVLALPMLIIALAIKLDSKGPVFFKQKRVGKNKEHFNILKFRTMRIDTPHDAPTHELQDPKKWITKVGGFLRKTSLDELPQLFNIWLGQMAVIGPRPALWNQFDLIEERDKYGANDVRPGLTGWAQINGRDLVSPEEKVRWDVKYLERCGLWTDFLILLATVPKVFGCVGISDEQ